MLINSTSLCASGVSAINCINLQETSPHLIFQNHFPTYGTRHFTAAIPPLTSLSPERTSSSLMSIRPSRRSVYRSVIRQDTRARWELTHLVKVFFCTASRSSVSKGEFALPPITAWGWWVRGTRCQPKEEEQSSTVMNLIVNNSGTEEPDNPWLSEPLSITTSRAPFACTHFIFSHLCWGSRM